MMTPLGSAAAAEDSLQQVWRIIYGWTATQAVRGVVDRQVPLVHQSLQPSVVPVKSVSGELPSDVSASPAKKKRRLKQAQLTVTEGGFLCSQRPGKASSQPSDTTASHDSSPPAAGAVAANTMQQLLSLQHPDITGAAAARLAGVIACLSPTSVVPAVFVPHLCLHSSLGAAAGQAEDGAAQQEHDTEAHAAQKVRLLWAVLRSLVASPRAPALLVACVSQQVVAWLPRLSSHAEVLADFLPALLLALVATVNSTAAEPATAETHRRVWQEAIEWMQGPSSLYSTGVAGPPSPLSAATSVAWFTLSKLLQWGGSAPVSAAAAQMHAACTSRDSAHAVAATQLLPFMCLLQHAHCEVASLQEQLPGAASAGTGSGRLPQHDVVTVCLGNGIQQVAHSLLDSLPALSGADAATLQLSALQAVSRVLEASVRCLTAAILAQWLQEVAETVLRIQDLMDRRRAERRQWQCSGSARAAARGQDAELLGLLDCRIPPLLAPSERPAGQQQQPVPALSDLAPVLQLALGSHSGPTVHSAVQESALHLVHNYLAAISQPALLAGSKALLISALDLIVSADTGVRDAALDLVRQYLHPAVLQEAFGDDIQVEQSMQSADTDAPNTPQRRLLEHLRQLLTAVTTSAGAHAQQQQGLPTRLSDSAVAAKISLLRAITGLYGGLLGSGHEDLVLLCLLEQQCPAICPDDRVQAAALDLLQYLANKYTSSKEPGQLLMDSQATPALLTAVGKALATQPELFAQLASAAKMDEGHLAEAVAPHVVHWLCQQKLTEPLELLASKLGQSASSLFFSKSDEVLADQLWFNPDGLSTLIDWVDGLMASTPNSSQGVDPNNNASHTFFTVVRIMGRRMARCVVEKAGLSRFWGKEHRPPADVLDRALSYVEILVDVMEGMDSVIDLLQGETMATLLKNIGKTLSKQPQQEQVVQETGASNAQQGDVAAAGSISGLQDEKLQALRSLIVLMHLLDAHIGSHAFQLMAVLSEALLYCTKGELLMQAISGWLSFVQLLAAHAPEVLQRVAAQAAVVLLPVLELASQGMSDTAGDADGAAQQSAVDAAAVQHAASVLHEIVVKQRAAVRPALHDMPPLPSLDMLKEVNAVLAKEQNCQTPLQHLQLLIAALQHESVAVRHVGLGEVRSFLVQYKTFMGDAMSGLLSCSGPAALPGGA
eukprot:GHUV01012892.1.p1 GENE.GHUV01012892.1~~GHUV01012892.1.p1  ORF type:complete len:1174 (+),score=406.36 GHUV01012892.1:1698-5219(+)